MSCFRPYLQLFGAWKPYLRDVVRDLLLVRAVLAARGAGFRGGDGAGGLREKRRHERVDAALALVHEPKKFFEAHVLRRARRVLARVVADPPASLDLPVRRLAAVMRAGYAAVAIRERVCAGVPGVEVDAHEEGGAAGQGG